MLRWSWGVPAGTGKTMLASALGVCACQQGRRVRLTTLAGLATELQEADSRRELARVVGRYSRIEVLLLDELGYLGRPDGAAELVFQVISERNERGSLIVTTNLPFGNGPRCSPTRGSRKRSSIGSPTRRTSSIPAPTAGASATGCNARRARRHAPRPAGALAAVAATTIALRATAAATTAATCTPPGDQATSTPTTTDEKWGQVRPSRWGQRKSSFSAVAAGSQPQPAHALLCGRLVHAVRRRR
jgi:hypothetical protein